MTSVKIYEKRRKDMKQKTSQSLLALATLATAAILALPNLALAAKPVPLTLNPLIYSG